jgi:hypothetical protein
MAAWLIITGFGTRWSDFMQLLLPSLVIKIDFKRLQELSINLQPILSSLTAEASSHSRSCSMTHFWIRVRLRVTFWLAVYRQSIYLDAKLLETHDKHFLQLNPCGHSPYVTLLGFANAVILGPSPAELITIFYCLRLETPPTWRARSPYLYPPGTAWPSFNPRHWVTFSSPPTTRRATVEVFEPASTRVNCLRPVFWLYPLITPRQGPYGYLRLLLSRILVYLSAT